VAKKVNRYKYYVGKVLHIVGRKREYEMTFARRSTKASLVFTWPTVVDTSYVEHKQLMCELTLQKEDRRGKLIFPTRELEYYKDYLQ
jgi:hypothetical protein